MSAIKHITLVGSKQAQTYSLLPQEPWHGFSASLESSIWEIRLHYPGNQTQGLLLSVGLKKNTCVLVFLQNNSRKYFDLNLQQYDTWCLMLWCVLVSGRVRGGVPRITPDSGLIMGLPAVKAHYADIISRISPTRYHQISARAPDAVCCSPEVFGSMWAVVDSGGVCVERGLSWRTKQ